MANYDSLKAAIQDVVKTNGNKEITGALLQQSLLAMINSLGAGYQFAGVAIPATDPGTPDYNVFYFAGPGTYPNFNNATIPAQNVGLLSYNGTWNVSSVQTTPFWAETIVNDIIQLYDGSTPVYPRTRAEAVFFDGDTEKTLEKIFSKAMLKKDWLKLSGTKLVSGAGNVVVLSANIGMGDIVTVGLTGLGSVFSFWRIYNHDTGAQIASVDSEEYTFMAESEIQELRINIGSAGFIASGNVNYSMSVAGWEDKLLSVDNFIDNVFFSKNILFGRNIGVYHNALYSNIHTENNAYTYFVIPVVNGETIYINPRARFISKNGTIIINGFSGGAYTPDFTGNLYVTFYNSDVNWIVTKETSFSGIIGYNFFEKFVIDSVLNGESTNPISNSAVYAALLHKSEYQYGYGAINLLENAERVDGAYYGTMHVINDNYLYFKVHLEANVEYYLSWGLRYISKAGAIIQNIQPANEAFITFKPTETTDYYITFRYTYPTYFVGKKDDFHIDNVLFGKKWVSCGDSFTHGDFSGATGEYRFGNIPYKGQNMVYPFFIGRRCGMHIVNEAINGSTMAYIDGSRNEFSTPNGRYTQIPSDADYITLWFGINDNHQSVPIGTIDDNVNTTFYGAWNIVMQYLLEHHPNAKIGIVITNGCADVNYPVAIRNIAKKWGVSYLDINGDYKVPLMLRTSEKTDVAASVLQDIREKQSVDYPTNQHPNVFAHEYQSTFIEEWLKML